MANTNKTGHHLDTETLNLYMETFQVFDKDGDGLISREEMKGTMEQMGQCPSERAVDYVMKKYDKNRTGMIEFNEFTMMINDMKETMIQREVELQNAFKIFDYNANGQVSSEAVKEALYSLGDVYDKDEIDDMVKMADGNGDGMLDYKEFVRMMTNKGH